MSRPSSPRRLISRLVAFLAAVFVAGCASVDQRRDTYGYNIQQGNLEQAEQIIEKKYQQNRDQLLKDLHLASVKQLKGEYPASNELFEEAKQRADRLSAISVTEAAAAISVNQRLSQFGGNRFERVMIFFHKAINYIALDDLAAARIEMSQAELLLSEWKWDAARFPFIPLILGLIYEALGDDENALVAYRRAAASYRQAELAAPQLLRQSYVDLLAAKGRRQELGRVRRQLQTEPSGAEQSAKLIVIAGRGVMTPLDSFTIWHLHPNLHRNFLIALPIYASRYSTASPPQVRITGESATIAFEPIIDAEREMRAELDRRMPGIITLALARAVVKSQIQQQTEQGSTANLLVTVFNLASEIADTRSWDSLPQVFYLGRVALAPGDYSLNGAPEPIKLEAGLNFIYLPNR